MADRSSIEWTDSTFNPWIGCTKVSPACDHCYAEVSTPSRTRSVKWGAGQPRQRTSAGNWAMPLRWNAKPFAQCADCGWRGDWPKTEAGSRGACPSCVDGALVSARRRVFCASLADVFDNEVPAEWLVDLLDLIRRTPNLDWLLLTKRIGNWRTRIQAAIFSKTYLSQELATWLGEWNDGKPPANVWIGATICNQVEADRDIPKLLSVPAAVRFLSIEPLLGAVDLGKWLAANDLREIDGGPGLDWVICGGESGPHARPLHPWWPRMLRNQCARSGVPFNYKQHGEWLATAFCDDAMAMLPSKRTVYVRYSGEYFELGGGYGFFDNIEESAWVGKKAAGRLLDGVLHDAYPEVRRG